MNRLVLFLCVGALVHPLTAPVADLFFGGRGMSQLLSGSELAVLGRLVFFGAFALAPMAGFGLIGTAMKGLEATSRPVRWMGRAAGVTALVTSPVAQVMGWAQLHTDAQAALLFLFLPMWAALLAVAAGVVAFVVGLAWPGARE